MKRLKIQDLSVLWVFNEWSHFSSALLVPTNSVTRVRGGQKVRFFVKLFMDDAKFLIGPHQHQTLQGPETMNGVTFTFSFQVQFLRKVYKNHKFLFFFQKIQF